jgi:hypothetical protein
VRVDHVFFSLHGSSSLVWPAEHVQIEGQQSRLNERRGVVACPVKSSGRLVCHGLLTSGSSVRARRVIHNNKKKTPLCFQDRDISWNYHFKKNVARKKEYAATKN